jgi:hypothetical protein
MEVVLNDWQSKAWSDSHRFKVICAGRRSGKSTFAQLTVINWARQEGLYWIVAPTYAQAKQIHWQGIQHYIPQKLISKKNETELSIEFINGAKIQLKSAENPDSLRGVKLRGLVVDEVASIRNWKWLWQEVLRPTLTDYEAPAIFIGTPKGFNHFFELYEEGQKVDSIYKSFRFNSYENPYIPRQEIDQARKELTEDNFQQEYMADFRKHTGIAHKEWNRDIHFIDPFDIPSGWQYARGFDYGSVDFTASVRVAIDKDVWFVDSCYLNNTSDVKGHADAIRSQDYGLEFVPCWGDPTGKQWVAEFAMHELHIQNANKMVGQGFRGWVDYCVGKVNERLKPVPGNTVYLPNGKVIENAPRLFVLKNGKTDKFVSQIEALSWKETITGEIVPILEDTGDPTGGHYDLMAAFRYLAVSYQPQNNNFVLPDDTRWVNRI